MRLRFPVVLAGLALASCNLAPTYKAPPPPAAAAFKEAGPWQQAKPSDALPRGAWWRLYNDPTLDKLEGQLNVSNPDLAAAFARYQQARAYAAEAYSGFFPTIDLGGSGMQSGLPNGMRTQGPRRPFGEPNRFATNVYDVGAIYEVDFWDQVANRVAAGEAEAQAAAGDLATVRLSLDAELAADYLSLRGLDSEIKLLNDTVAAYHRALEIVQNRFTGKISPALDVARAETQLDSAEAYASDAVAQRALMEHAIATLVGVPASSFSLPPAIIEYTVPNVPPGLPAQLLERRPDIAAAERRVASANAQIGVARAAFYPNVTLNALGGFENAGLTGLTQSPGSFWAIGPGAVLPLFEGGLRHAVEAGAYAAFNRSAANYRAVVLAAFQEVEDNLALLHYLGQESQQEQLAVTAANKTLNLSMDLYRDGAVNYLEVVFAQAEALQAELGELSLTTRILLADVHLIRGLGGGWEASDLPNPEETSRIPKVGLQPIPVVAP